MAWLSSSCESVYHCLWVSHAGAANKESLVTLLIVRELAFTVSVSAPVLASVVIPLMALLFKAKVLEKDLPENL